MNTRKTWKEFRESGLLWWTNRILQTFGWVILIEVDDEGNVTEAYPAKTKWRGFDAEFEKAGYSKVTKHLAENIETLVKDVE